jgi:hypothetical protein
MSTTSQHRSGLSVRFFPFRELTPYSVLLPVDDLAALQALSQEQGESVSFHIREAIRRYLKDRRKETP